MCGGDSLMQEQLCTAKEGLSIDTCHHYPARSEKLECTSGAWPGSSTHFGGQEPPLVWNLHKLSLVSQGMIKP